MDYAAIADVHSIKRQIHAHKGHGEIAVKGHNVKLGRGGIREIEFFVQTQQLIAGGRFPELRGRETVPMLAQLAARGWITAEARDALTAQYWFLRRVEHAIQMVADEQTHTLPDDDEGLERIAHHAGLCRCATLSRPRFAPSLQEVERHYAALFETAPELSAGIGNLVFTGDVDDPDTLQTLHGLGFAAAERHLPRHPQLAFRPLSRHAVGRGARAADRADAGAAARPSARRAAPTRRCCASTSSWPACRPASSCSRCCSPTRRCCKLLATIMGAAPRLAAIITRRPHVFDGLLDPALLTELPDRAYLSARLAAFLEGAGPTRTCSTGCASSPPSRSS